MAVEGENEHATRGRANKAGQIERWARREGISSERMEAWTDTQWLEAARAAGITTAIRDGKVPSADTRELCLKFRRGREKADRRVAAMSDDEVFDL